MELRIFIFLGLGHVKIKFVVCINPFSKLLSKILWRSTWPLPWFNTANIYSTALKPSRIKTWSIARPPSTSKPRTGKRFWVENATIWTVTDPTGTFLGQAATFSKWTPIVDPNWTRRLKSRYSLLASIASIWRLKKVSCWRWMFDLKREPQCHRDQCNLPNLISHSSLRVLHGLTGLGAAWIIPLFK